MKQIFIIGMLILSIFGCRGPQGPVGPTGDVTFVTWNTAIEKVQDNVYMLGIIPSEQNYMIFSGTGWAISPTQIMTNAHVAYAIYDLCRLPSYNSVNSKIAAVKNGTFCGKGGTTFELIECSIHPDYDNRNSFSSDFAIFTIGTQLSSSVILLDDAKLTELKVGQHIGTMGFPGELFWQNNDAYQPIATFKDGIISALRPFDQQNTSQNSVNNVLLQYNFATTGGTSGSPVFLPSGEIIGIHNSGTYIHFEDKSGSQIRIGVGSLNFGIRLDQRTKVMSLPFNVKVADFRNPDPIFTSPLNSGQFKIVLDWASFGDFDLNLFINNSQFITSYYDSSRANIYPFAVHFGNNNSFGPEKALLTRLSEETLIYATNFTLSAGSFGKQNATCQISASNGIIATVTPTLQDNFRYWVIGKLTSNGAFTPVNQLTNNSPLQKNQEALNKLLKQMDIIPEKITLLKAAN